MSEFRLVPFEFGGQTIEFFAGADEPHSRVLAAIAARNTMLDPDIAVDIARDNGPDGDYLAVFESILVESQQSYLMGRHPPGWFISQARQYAAEHPAEGLLDLVEFAAANPPDASGFGPGGSQGRGAVRAVDKDKAKRKQKAAHKARMKNKR